MFSHLRFEDLKMSQMRDVGKANSETYLVYGDELAGVPTTMQMTYF